MGNINLRNKKHDSYLKDQLANGSFVSFMLFVGQVGTGKRNTAYSFAAAVLCEKGNGEPCEACAGCKLIETGNHPDLIKLGGGETIKIANIRELQKNLYLKPYMAGHKVAVIEDAHFMTEASANAFLKVLEEPPKDSIVILISPDKTLLPKTVVSRSQIVDFGAAKSSILDIEEELKDDILKALNGKNSLSDRFSIVHKYAKDKSLVSDFLNGLEISLRSLFLDENVSKEKTIRSLEMVQESRKYLKRNLSAKFILENLVINI